MRRELLRNLTLTGHGDAANAAPEPFRPEWRDVIWFSLHLR